MPSRHLAVVVLLSVALPGSSADWPRFRGPNGTGVVEGAAPVQFDLKKDAAWVAKLPGVGHGSPIVVGDKVLLMTASVDGSARSILCLNAKDGKEAWTYTAGGAAAPTHKKNNLASGTPCSDGERVYAAFWDGTGMSLHAANLADGKKAWAADLGSYKSQHGAGHSPIVAGGLVVFNFDQDGAAELVAFDAKTGDRAWAVKREPHRACYDTPFLIEEPGKPAQLVVATTTTIDSYDPKTGKENWTHHVAWANPAKKLRAIAQPVLAAGQIVMATGDGDGSRYMLAVKADGGKTRRTWDLSKGLPYVPGPLVYRDHLYWIGDDGVAGCADAKTGEVKWSERVLQKGVSASPILIGDTVLAIAEDGKAVAFQAGPKGPGELKKSDVGEAVFATPAAANGRLYLRGDAHLFCVPAKGS